MHRWHGSESLSWIDRVMEWGSRHKNPIKALHEKVTLSCCGYRIRYQWTDLHCTTMSKKRQRLGCVISHLAVWAEFTQPILCLIWHACYVMSHQIKARGDFGAQYTTLTGGDGNVLRPPLSVDNERWWQQQQRGRGPFEIFDHFDHGDWRSSDVKRIKGANRQKKALHGAF